MPFNLILFQTMFKITVYVIDNVFKYRLTVAILCEICAQFVLEHTHIPTSEHVNIQSFKLSTTQHFSVIQLKLIFIYKRFLF